MKSICYLSDDFSKVTLPPDIIIAPEALKNENQLIEWVNNLKINPCTFATCSIFILRELYMQSVNVEYINIVNGDERHASDINDLIDLEILDRELRQSDRYINFELGISDA